MVTPVRFVSEKTTFGLLVIVAYQAKKAFIPKGIIPTSLTQSYDRV
jgi:hypothetical protein